MQAARRLPREAAEIAVERARFACPVSSESKPVHLIDTIRVEEDEATGGAALVAGDASKGVDYAAKVNYGMVTTSGPSGYRPGAYFMEQGEDAARDHIERRGRQVYK